MTTPAASVDMQRVCRTVVLWQWLADLDATEHAQGAFESVEYCVIRAPGDCIDAGIVARLTELVDRGLVRVLDVIAATPGENGSVECFELFENAAGDLDGLRRLQRDAAPRLDEEWLDRASLSITLGANGGSIVRVYENLKAAPLAAAVRRTGGLLVADGRVAIPRMFPPGGPAARS